MHEVEIEPRLGALEGDHGTGKRGTGAFESRATGSEPSTARPLPGSGRRRCVAWLPTVPVRALPGTTRASADTAGARYVPPSDARIVQQYRLGMRNGELTTAFRAKRKRSQPECFSTVVAVNRRGGTEESPADGLPPAIPWAAGLFGSGGGGGIRTHEPPYDGQRFSRPARRSSSPSGCRQSGCLGRMRNKRDLALRDHVDRQE